MSGTNKFREILSLTCIATAAVAAYQPVGFDDAPVTANDGKVKGVALNPAESGEAFAALSIGTIQVKAVGAIPAGSDLITDETGGVKVDPGGSSNVFATSLTAAADGELVDIQLR